jgi:hypothetical protein
MSLTDLRMQPTIHLKGKSEYLPRPYAAFAFQMYCGLHFQFLQSNLDMDAVNIQIYLPNVLWVAFSIPLSSLLLVNHFVSTFLHLFWCYNCVFASTFLVFFCTM